jgi:dUTP pyrophosphatase
MRVHLKKLHEKAVVPQYAKESDAGMDLTATSIIKNDDEQVVYGTGIALEIPEGYVGLVFPRSSIRKTDLVMSNSVGVIDAGYRGEIQVTFNKKYYDDEANVIYNVGDRVAQIIILPHPQVTFLEVDELSDSERGTGGHGSSGK